MDTTPPSSPNIASRDIRAAQTLAEHLPQGYTADFVPDEPETGQENANSSSDPSRSQSSSGNHRDGGQLASTPPFRSTSNVSSRPGRNGDAVQHDEISSLTLQGGDVHRSLFRMAEAPARINILQGQPVSSSASSVQPNQPKQWHHRRAATAHEVFGSEVGSVFGSDGDDTHHSTIGGRSVSPMPVRDMIAPQGFRRAFLQQQQKREAAQRRRAFLHERRVSSFAARIPITRNFVEFLELYGHFADEDLESSDDEDGGDDVEVCHGELGNEDEDENAYGERSASDSREEDGGLSEHRPLLARRGFSSASVNRGMSGESGKTKAGVAQSFFTLLKAFVGTGIMFLPKAYNNGGMAFSTLTLLVVAVLSMAGFQLLLQCRQHHGGSSSYGDIGRAVAGPRMRYLILGSIALSQLGFVCAGMVFVAENMASLADAVAGRADTSLDGPAVSSTLLIALEAAVLIPLAFVRDIARLGPAALLGDLFIGIGLAYMYAYDTAVLAARDWRPHPTVLPWFNPSGYTLTIGAAIFTFEGIGLILPIQSSMAHPERFGVLLTAVMSIITVAYISVGALGYATFGAYTKTEVIDNYPHTSALVQAVQFVYALAVLAGLPVQLFPAVRIIEGALFGRFGLGCFTSFARGGNRHGLSGKRSARVKWAKNGLRTILVIACASISVLGAGHLDRFVALIGSLACVPLLFIYPPYLHYLSIANSWFTRGTDLLLITVGVFAMIYTTVVTVSEGL